PSRPASCTSVVEKRPSSGSTRLPAQTNRWPRQPSPAQAVGERAPRAVIAEDSEPPRPTAAHRSFGDNAAVSRVAGAYRRLLDYEPSLRYPHLERRVVEVAHVAPPEPRRHRLVEASVQPNGVAARAER